MSVLTIFESGDDGLQIENPISILNTDINNFLTSSDNKKIEKDFTSIVSLAWGLFLYRKETNREDAENFVKRSLDNV
jgi:hypothetical protein